MLESVGGESFSASLSAAKRVTGRVVVSGVAGGTVIVSNKARNFRQQIQLIDLHIGVLVEHAPDLSGEPMGELRALQEAGMYTPGRGRTSCGDEFGARRSSPGT